MAAVYLKLEGQNPTGSYKDRMAKAMLLGAERAGRLGPGVAVLECTGGSTGGSLAFLCAIRGYACHILSSDCYAAEKLALMRVYGAQVHVEPSRGGQVTPDLWPRMLARAEALVAQGGYAYMDQFRNRDSLVGYAEVAEELLPQLPEGIDAFVAAVGTAGLITGAGARLRQAFPAVRLVAVEPASSAVLSGGPAGAHTIDGTGAGFVPPLFDRNLVREVLPVEEAAARHMVGRLAREEGIFAGPSTGLNVLAALRVARELGAGHTVVTVACDSGLKYPLP